MRIQSACVTAWLALYYTTSSVSAFCPLSQSSSISRPTLRASISELPATAEELALEIASPDDDDDNDDDKQATGSHILTRDSSGKKASFDTNSTAKTVRSTSTTTVDHCDIEYGLKKLSNEEKEEDIHLDDNDSVDYDNDYEDTDWKDLPPKVQRAAEILGYNERMWDKGKDPPSEDKSWRRLSFAEQEAAQILGYTKEKWDG